MSGNSEQYFFVLSNNRKHLEVVKELIENHQVGVIEDGIEEECEDVTEKYKITVAVKKFKDIQTKGSERLLEILNIGGVLKDESELPSDSDQYFIVKCTTVTNPYRIYKQCYGRWIERLAFNIDRVGLLAVNQ